MRNRLDALIGVASGKVELGKLTKSIGFNSEFLFVHNSIYGPQVLLLRALLFLTPVHDHLSIQLFSQDFHVLVDLVVHNPCIMLCGGDVLMSKHLTYRFDWYAIEHGYGRSKRVPCDVVTQMLGDFG